MRKKPTYDELKKRNIELESEAGNSGISFSEVLQRISVPTFVLDNNHEVVHWNMALERLSGISATEMVGTNQHWKAFYPLKRPTLADFVVDSMHEDVISGFYEGKYRKSLLADAAYEAEEYFPGIGQSGKWLFLSATPIPHRNGNIIGAVETLQDITKRKRVEGILRESQKRYKELSITDSLTKLYNSRQFFRQLIQETQRANRYKHPLSLMLLDIDNFKGYNDMFGHLEGDNALTVLADVMKKALRRTDTACRYGGEEFTVLLPETRGEGAMEVAERIRKNFANSFYSEPPRLKVQVTISVGVTGYIHDQEITAFLSRADAAMYEAKKKGKNCIYFAG